MGHHWPNRWTAAQSDARLAELFIAGELLAMGGALILETVLHEAAHALAHVRGIKDCSRSGNRYHNRRFAQLADELGLTPPATSSPATGFSECTLASETTGTYAATIQALDGVALASTPDPGARLLTGASIGPRGHWLRGTKRTTDPLRLT